MWRKRSTSEHAPRPARRRALLTAAGVVALAGTSALALGAASADVPVTKIPSSARAAYLGYQKVARLQPNPYASWTPKKAPWKFCLNESLLQNGWRQGNLAELKKLTSQYKAAGLAKGDLQVTNSNGNAALQISQFNSLVSAGCDVIFTLPGSPTALCPAIATAQKKGILVITDDTAVNCASAINVTFNGYLNMKLGATSVFKALGGKGNVLVVTGYKGSVGEAVEEAAIRAALNSYPDIKIIGEVEGQWTPSVAQTATATFLQTHPDKIDGILDEGEMGVAAQTALEQAGRPLAKVNFSSGECAAFAFWKAHPANVTQAASQAPGAAAYESFLVAVRMLTGAKPITNTLIYPIPQLTGSKIGTFYKPSMTVKSTCYADSPNVAAVPDTYFNALLKGGRAIPKPLKG